MQAYFDETNYEAFKNTPVWSNIASKIDLNLN